MNKTVNTPFAEYREEQVKINIFDYFVEPSFFEKFCDTKSVLISGSRGSGKTTILKALTLGEAKNKKKYLDENKYIGVYYRIDLNITAAFQGEVNNLKEWEKLFSYYFVASLSYELITRFKDITDFYSSEEQKNICEKYGKLFARKSEVYTFEELQKVLFDELFNIRDYINNCAYEEFPHIGDYATIIRELPKDLLIEATDSSFADKTIFYLVDEFEGLYEWQQKVILSFVKYADEYHAYKICMRPDGLKTAQTIGNEYIRESDDIRTIDLNELILENRDEYYKYALDVCKKRIELFYIKNGFDWNSDFEFESYFEEVSEDEEFESIINKKRANILEVIDKFLNENCLLEEHYKDYFNNNIFEFFMFRLIYWKNNNKYNAKEILEWVQSKNKNYMEAVGNYKHSMLYYLCYKYSIPKTYSGFKTLVNISGGTLRYLLELCNEIFERAVLYNQFEYNNPSKISARIQTVAVAMVSKKRVNQISAIPQIGLNMRTFVMAIGRIFGVFHRDERISKFETNHFAIKTTNSNIDENLSLFLKECVMRGVLLKKKNNKQKDSLISFDEYLYMLHPIYTPSFQISWRCKQKVDFDVEELQVLLNNDSKEIGKIIAKYRKRYLQDNSSNGMEEGFYQTKLILEEDENGRVF